MGCCKICILLSLFEMEDEDNDKELSIFEEIKLVLDDESNDDKEDNGNIFFFPSLCLYVH